jgi:hypothetical protein
MSLFAHRNWLRALALGQVVSLGAAGCKSAAPSAEVHQQALVGADGAYTVSAANTVVNGYSAIVGTATAGTSTVAVNNVTDFTFKQNTTDPGTALAVGDLVMLVQAAGATINTADTAAYGTVSDLGGAGRYELVGVTGITGNNLTLSCALKNSYDGSKGAQVVRVPQYTNLTINAAASISALPWDGTRGGVVAVHASSALVLNGDIDASAKGFRGGAIIANDATTRDFPAGITLFRSANELDGGEKGEGIAGLASTLAGGQYGRGAPANAGGGGNSHNAAGGGGANASVSGTWTGNGVMNGGTADWSQAWHLEVGTTGSLANSPGGGRGGYSYSSANLSPLTVTPGDTTWSGDYRSVVGGLGGRPLANAAGGTDARLYFGGGGGAGDGNNAVAGRGGRGGGLVFILAGTVDGAGRVLANGETGGEARSANDASGDAAGGGGGGGSIVIHADSVKGIAVQAKGGAGGNQVINKSLTVDTPYEAEGPGGGGGGGFVAISGADSSVTTTVAGGGAGTTNARSMGAFAVNGATDGHAGLANGDASSILYCATAAALDTTIASKPSNPSKLAQAPFTFTSNATGATFECALDTAADSNTFTACPSTYTTAALPEGTHKIKVRAKDLSGNVDATPDSYTWVIDLTEPDTKIDRKPTDPSGPSVTFTFTSTEDGSTFQCHLDAEDWKTCPASYPITDLTNGSHTIYVRAIDKAGNVDSTPDHYTWTVDATPPDTTIVNKPTDPSPTSAVPFTFTGSETAVTFECRWEKAGEWTACQSPLIKPLTNGSHTFEVRAKDAVGNVDPTPATWTGVVNDTTAPDTTITSHPSAISTTTRGSFTFESNEAGVTFECRLEKTGDWKTCPSSYTVDVTDGSHTIEVRARDGAGNVDATPDIFTWVVQTGGPVIIDAGADAGDAGTVVYLDGGEADARKLDGAADTASVLDATGGDAVDTRPADTAPVVDTRPADTATVDTRPSVDLAPAVDTRPAEPDAVTPDPGAPAVKLMGGGFCAVNPNAKPGLFTLFLVGALGTLIVRRRRR